MALTAPLADLRLRGQLTSSVSSANRALASRQLSNVKHIDAILARERAVSLAERSISGLVTTSAKNANSVMSSSLIPSPVRPSTAVRAMALTARPATLRPTDARTATWGIGLTATTVAELSPAAQASLQLARHVAPRMHRLVTINVQAAVQAITSHRLPAARLTLATREAMAIA
jgi:hypothetical protein